MSSVKSSISVKSHTSLIGKYQPPLNKKLTKVLALNLGQVSKVNNGIKSETSSRNTS